MKVIESVCSKVAVIDNSKIAEVGDVSEVFSNPKSEIAKELVIPDLIRSIKNQNGYKFRLVFNGESSNTPTISALALEKGISANIIYADTKLIDGKIYGHLVFTLSGGREQFEETKKFLEEKGVKYFAEAE